MKWYLDPEKCGVGDFKTIEYVLLLCWPPPSPTLPSSSLPPRTFQLFTIECVWNSSSKHGKYNTHRHTWNSSMHWNELLISSVGSINILNHAPIISFYHNFLFIFIDYNCRQYPINFRHKNTKHTLYLTTTVYSMGGLLSREPIACILTHKPK